jgi:hypothetical protein
MKTLLVGIPVEFFCFLASSDYHYSLNDNLMSKSLPGKSWRNLLLLNYPGQSFDTEFIAVENF